LRETLQAAKVHSSLMILVLVPIGFAVPPQLWERAAILPYGTVEDLVAALAQPHDAAVIVTDALPEASLEPVAAAIRASAKPCIEVRSERWDGESFSAVSAACRGVISGFGADGLLAGVREVEAELRAAAA
jgi:3-dehydroquinate dehydratase